MLNAAGIVFRSPEGRVLLLRRTDKTWDYPGGGCKEGEDAAKAAVREAYEETKYRAGHAGTFLMRRVRGGVDYTTFLYDCDDEFVPKLSKEHTDYLWIKPQTVLAESIKAKKEFRADKAGWDEGKHPRGPDGKFISGLGSGGKPKSESGWTQVSGKKGYTEGGIFKDPEGNNHYVKFPAEGPAKVEALAGDIATLMGTKTLKPEYQITNGKASISTDYNPDLIQMDKNDIAVLSKKPEFQKQLAEVYATAVVTNNWDAIGGGGGMPLNLMFDPKTQQIIQIDLGGSLDKSGVGGTKLFQANAPEVEGFLNPNYTTGAVFGPLFEKNPALYGAALEAVNKVDMDAAQWAFANSGVPNAEGLFETFKARHNAIKQKLQEKAAQAAPAAPEPAAEPAAEAVGAADEKKAIKDLAKKKFYFKKEITETIDALNANEDIEKLEKSPGKIAKLIDNYIKAQEATPGVAHEETPEAKQFVKDAILFHMALKGYIDAKKHGNGDDIMNASESLAGIMGKLEGKTVKGGKKAPAAKPSVAPAAKPFEPAPAGPADTKALMAKVVANNQLLTESELKNWMVNKLSTDELDSIVAVYGNLSQAIGVEQSNYEKAMASGAEKPLAMPPPEEAHPMTVAETESVVNEFLNLPENQALTENQMINAMAGTLSVEEMEAVDKVYGSLGNAVKVYKQKYGTLGKPAQGIPTPAKQGMAQGSLVNAKLHTENAVKSTYEAFDEVLKAEAGPNYWHSKAPEKYAPILNAAKAEYTGLSKHVDDLASAAAAKMSGGQALSSEEQKTLNNAIAFKQKLGAFLESKEAFAAAAGDPTKLAQAKQKGLEAKQQLQAAITEAKPKPPPPKVPPEQAKKAAMHAKLKAQTAKKTARWNNEIAPWHAAQNAEWDKDDTKKLKTFQAVRPVPTASEEGPVSSYKGSGYQSQNTHLRTTGEHSAATLEVHSWLDRSEIPEDTTLFRGVNGEYATMVRSMLKNNTTFVDRGFSSCSTRRSFSQGWAALSKDHGMMLRVDVKKGQKGAAIRAGSDGEYEVVLQSNSVFNVVSFDFEKRYAHLELVEQHPIDWEED